MNRGINLLIPNRHGSVLGELLEPFDTAACHWYNGGEEAYFIQNGKLEKPLFQGEICGMDGALLKEIIDNNEYYVMFADLKAYPKETSVVNVETYEEFLDSRCQLVLLVSDCEYVSIYCKDQEILERLYNHAISKGFAEVKYVTDDNDSRTGLSVW